MKNLILIIFISFGLYAQEVAPTLKEPTRLYECTKIFEERKSELVLELERIDEAKQALNALKVATDEMLKRKETILVEKEKSVDAKLKEVSQKEENTKIMLAKNEKALKDLKETKMSKVSQTYAKMKAASAAGILSDMKPQEAVMILKILKPKTVGKILSKMPAKKASIITVLLGDLSSTN
ncbi:MAG: PDP protein [Helicobacteraceae bacterium]|nr:PDP protein [Helicobacteraceae bacterium]